MPEEDRDQIWQQRREAPASDEIARRKVVLLQQLLAEIGDGAAARQTDRHILQSAKSAARAVRAGARLGGQRHGDSDRIRGSAAPHRAIEREGATARHQSESVESVALSAAATRSRAVRALHAQQRGGQAVRVERVRASAASEVTVAAAAALALARATNARILQWQSNQVA